MTLAESALLSSRSEKILVVDDESIVREILCEHLQGEGLACQQAASGKEALHRLEQENFSLIIADIRMPEVNGLQLLDHVRRHHPDTSMIMITAVIDLQTAVESMKQGACDYITKPFELEKVAESVKRALHLRRVRLEDRKIAQNLEALVRRKSFALNSALKDLEKHHQMTLEALVRALDARGHETQCHSQRVQAYTVRLAQEFGFQDRAMVELARGSLLHDIGKIGISDTILLKPGPLTPEEWTEMKKHPVIGYEILRGVKFLDRAAEMVLSHHERYDGSGYPRGLRKEEIPLEARIFSVLDAYDAMTSDRPYRPALSQEAARREIESKAGSQFDPEVVERFLKISPEEWEKIRRRFS